MSGADRASRNGEACLIAAEQVQRKLLALARKIDRLQDPSVAPNNPLPVDDFLSGMVKRENAPRIIFSPRRLKDKIWTESTTAYVYAGIEAAFERAGRLPGGNRSGHVRELRNLKTWIENQEKDPSRAVPKYFVQNTALLFSKGILEERRKDRIEVISDIGHFSPSRRSDLAQLKKWLDEDLADSRLRKKGRPTDYQKIVFAAEIAGLWNALTGQLVSKGPETNFARFLVACWKSGFVGMEVNSSFKRVIRHHIAEREEPYECGRCDGCRRSGKCERKRYFGILA